MVKYQKTRIKDHFKNLIFKTQSKQVIVTKTKKAKKEKNKSRNKPIFGSTVSVRNTEGCKSNFITFQISNDLFTLLYSSIVFQWIESDRVIILNNLVNNHRFRR